MNKNFLAVILVCAVFTTMAACRKNDTKNEIQEVIATTETAEMISGVVDSPFLDNTKVEMTIDISAYEDVTVAETQSVTEKTGVAATTTTQNTSTNPTSTSKPTTSNSSSKNSTSSTTPTTPTKPNTDTNPTKPSESTKPTTATTPTIPTEATEPSATEKPDGELDVEMGVVDFEETDYEKYIKMSGSEQMAFMESFKSVEAFFSWYNDAKAEYQKNNAGIPVGNGAIDLDQILGK